MGNKQWEHEGSTDSFVVYTVGRGAWCIFIYIINMIQQFLSNTTVKLCEEKYRFLACKQKNGMLNRGLVSTEIIFVI